MDRSCLRVNVAYSNDLRRWLGLSPTRRIGHQRQSCFAARRLAPLHLHTFLLPLWHFQYRTRYGLFQLHGSFRRHPSGKHIRKGENRLGKKQTKHFPIAQRRKIIAQLNFVDLNSEWCPISEGDSSHPANAHNYRRSASLQPQRRNPNV